MLPVGAPRECSPVGAPRGCSPMQAGAGLSLLPLHGGDVGREPRCPQGAEIDGPCSPHPLCPHFSRAQGNVPECEMCPSAGRGRQPLRWPPLAPAGLGARQTQACGPARPGACPGSHHGMPGADGNAEPSSLPGSPDISSGRCLLPNPLLRATPGCLGDPPQGPLPQPGQTTVAVTRAEGASQGPHTMPFHPGQLLPPPQPWGPPLSPSPLQCPPPPPSCSALQTWTLEAGEGHHVLPAGKARTLGR